MTPSPTATAAAHAPIAVAGRSFATKADLGRSVRALMARYPDAVPLEGDDERFVRSLLDRHPRREQKLGAGIAWIEVRSVASPGRSRRSGIVRPDGSSTDVSWRSCITPPAYRRAVLAALRSAIQGQVLMFRVKEFAGDRAPVFCPLTGEPLTPATAHVDHEHPFMFEVLVRDFLAAEGLRLEDVAVRGYGDGMATRRLVSPALELAWQRFHYRHAKLRLLSPRGNLSLARRANRDATREG